MIHKRIKIGSAFSDWKDLVKRFSQGSILGPLLFNILLMICFFSWQNMKVCNFAHYNCLYSCGMNLENIFSNPINYMENIHEWFVYNSLKGNPDTF